MEAKRIAPRPRQCGGAGLIMEPYRAKERALIAQLMIDLIRALYRGRLGEGEPFSPAGIEKLMLSGAVLLAHVQGKPKNASDLARVLDVPRVTALRRLKDLEKSGIIIRHGSKYYMAELRPGNDAYIDKCLTLIRRAAQL